MAAEFRFKISTVAIWSIAVTTVALSPRVAATLLDKLIFRARRSLQLDEHVAFPRLSYGRHGNQVRESDDTGHTKGAHRVGARRTSRHLNEYRRFLWLWTLGRDSSRRRFRQLQLFP